MRLASCVVSTQHRGTLVAPGIPNSLCACLLEIRQANPRRAQNMGTSWQFSPRKGPLFSTHVPSSRPLSPSAFPLQQPLYQLPGPTPRAPAARATWEQVIHPPLLLILCGFLVWLTAEPGRPHPLALPLPATMATCRSLPPAFCREQTQGRGPCCCLSWVTLSPRCFRACPCSSISLQLRPP